METGKPGLVSAPVHISSVAAQTGRRTDMQTPLRAVYIHTVPALPAQPYPQPPAAAREPATLHLAVPPLYSNETLPFLTLHIAGGLQSQPGLSVAAGAPASRPRSAGKHVCPHCGRDCMKPSVLEKHLRCHTGERPYPCATCGVSFKTQSNLYKHKRTQAHARLSSESEQSSLDSMSGSRETCASSLSLDEHTDESESTEKDDMSRPSPAHASRAQGSESEQNGSAPAGRDTEPSESAKARVEEDKQTVESENAPLIVSRHLPLQRQEATLFSKQWESSVSGGKSQSHESTDSGFSESNDHYPSPASVLPDHSMDSLAECSKEHLEEITTSDAPSGPGQGGQEPRDTARDQEQRTLEERISRLISENTAVVEDKQLDNVRPRKTVLSKQGSIDLPMPYTYKDSFHFDMKIGKTPNVGLQRSRAPGLYSSVPTQRSSAAEHAPLARSNSLPFSVTLLQPEKSSPASALGRDYATLARRGSSGQIAPASFTMKPVNQQSSAHRPLVRQTAVDCNHATDGHSMNSSVEEACSGSLSCDGDAGEMCAEPSSRKFRRKKAPKFAYNKWYMYGGGTFKKLYNAEKGGDAAVIKGRKCFSSDPEVRRLSAVQKEAAPTSLAAESHPGCPPAEASFASGVKTSQPRSVNSPLKAPLQRNLSLSVLPLSAVGSLVSLNASGTDTARFITDGFPSQLFGAHVPSDRKKQKTDDKITFPLRMETVLNAVTHPLPSVTGRVPQQEANRSSVNFPENPKHTQVKDAAFLPRILNANVPSVGTSLAASVASAAKTSFLPKYQLKLPNVSEADSNSSSHALDNPSGADVHSSTSAPPSCSEQTSPLDKEPVFPPLVQTCDAFSCTQTQLVPPCTASLCPTKTCPVYESVTSSLPGDYTHRQFAATTKTTTCLKNDQAGICSTSVQPSQAATGSAPTRFPGSHGTATVNTTNEAFTGRPSFNRPSSHSQAAAAGAFVGQDTPAAACHGGPFRQEQPVSQNVFHVHTADLQICLQIISDEQLALIEPQIERQAANSHHQRRDTQPGPRTETDHTGSLPTGHAGGEKSPVHVGQVQPNVHPSDSSQATISAESQPPETPGLTLRPHKCSNGSSATEALSSDAATAASLTGVNSAKHQTSDEEQSLLEKRVNQSQFIQPTCSGAADLSMTCAPPSTEGQSSTRSQEKPPVAVAPACRSSRLESGGAHSAVQVVSQASGCLRADEVSAPGSGPAQLNAPAPTQHSPPGDMGLCKPATRGCHSDSAPSQEMIPHEAKGFVTFAHSEEQLGPTPAASWKTREDKPRDAPAALSGLQSATAGVTEAASPEACAGQEPPQDAGRAGTPGRRPSQAAAATRPQRAEAQGGGSLEGEDGDAQTHQGQDLKVAEEAFTNSWLSEQHLSQTGSGTSESRPPSPQQAPGSPHSRDSPSRRGHTSLFNLPPRETNTFYFSQQQQWESSIARNHHTLSPCQAKVDDRVKAGEPSAQPPDILSQQELQAPSVQPGTSVKGTGAAGSCCLCPGVHTPTDAAEGFKGTAEWTGSSSAGTFTHAGREQGTEPWPPHDYAAHISDAGRSDTRYQTLYLTGQFHSFQPGECLSNGVRPVPTCHDYSEDTSSSDEEGKLIIEL